MIWRKLIIIKKLCCDLSVFPSSCDVNIKHLSSMYHSLVCHAVIECLERSTVTKLAAMLVSTSCCLIACLFRRLCFCLGLFVCLSVCHRISHKVVDEYS